MIGINFFLGVIIGVGGWSRGGELLKVRVFRNYEIWLWFIFMGLKLFYMIVVLGWKEKW